MAALDDKGVLSLYDDMLWLTAYADNEVVWFACQLSINDLAAVIRGRRLSLGLSQGEAATRTGVSRQWVSALERGKPTAELGLVLGLLDALELNLELAVREDGGRPTVSVDLDAVLDEHRGP